MKHKTNLNPLIIIVSTLVLFLSAMPMSAFAETGKRPDKNSALKGKEIFETYCQTCHGNLGIGEPAAPVSIRDPSYFVAPALDHTQHAWHHTDEDLIKFILEGSKRTQRMPAWKKVLSKNDVRHLVDYIKSLWDSRSLECQGPKHMSCM